jgi:murein DD-endopeptidase MepM/ murein hydrolase activator NlpD
VHTVIPVADGVVVESGFSGGFGNMVTVQQQRPPKHCLRAPQPHQCAQRGQTVKQGDSLGAAGSTGWATGPHLHFDSRINGRHVDPLTLAQQGSSEPISAAVRPRVQPTRPSGPFTVDGRGANCAPGNVQ